ncbi:MAG: DALR anticodon-binding domain-containing protein, partial [Flavobacteriaceae bacterium]
DYREKAIVKHLLDYPKLIQQAASQYSPALVANYCYDLVKLFNSFYQNITILGEEDQSKQNFRVLLSQVVAEVLASGTAMLGIDVPERM